MERERVDMQLQKSIWVDEAESRQLAQDAEGQVLAMRARIAKKLLEEAIQSPKSKLDHVKVLELSQQTEEAYRNWQVETGTFPPPDAEIDK
jgi:hypothetical protein